MIPLRFKLPKRNNPKFANITEFNLGEKLGEGGFSTVYQGEHIYTKCKFAIKIIDFDRLGTLDQENVQKEIEAHQNFHHPNIIRLVDYF